MKQEADSSLAHQNVSLVLSLDEQKNHLQQVFRQHAQCALLASMPQQQQAAHCVQTSRRRLEVLAFCALGIVANDWLKVHPSDT